MNHESFDEWIRQNANAHEAQVPADAWEKISGRKKKRRRFLLWWWIPLTAGILVLGYGGYRYAGKTKKSDLAEVRKTSGEKPDVDYNRDAVTGEAKQDKKIKVNGLEQAESAKETKGQADAEMTDVKIKENVVPAKADINKNITLRKNAKNAAIPERQAEKDSKEEKEGIAKKKYRDKEDKLRTVTTTVAKPEEITGAEKNIGPAKKEGNDQGITGDQTKAAGDSVAGIADGSSEKRPAAIAMKEWTIDSVYLQPENAVAAIVPRHQRRYFTEIYFTPFLPLQQVQHSGVSRVQETPGMKSEFRSTVIKSKPDVGWSAGIGLGKRINARWQIMTGLQYSTFSERVWVEGRETITHYNIVKRLVEQPGGPQLVDDTVESYQYGKRMIEASNRYHTWSIPLLAGYQLMQNRMISLQVQGGAILHIARRYRNNINGSFDPDNTDKWGNRPVAQGLDIQAGLRFMLHPQNRTRLFAEPAFRYSLLPAQTNEMLERKRLHQFGISVGVQYGF